MQTVQAEAESQAMLLGALITAQNNSQDILFSRSKREGSKKRKIKKQREPKKYGKNKRSKR